MPNFVLPRVYLTGASEINLAGVYSYLQDTGQNAFRADMDVAFAAGVPSGLILCSMYAKMCYASLVVGKNSNISKVRSIEDNIAATFEAGHGSVFEHCSLNFVVTNCSRVFTHEQVRHRVGAAYSQTSGRYVRQDVIGFVHDPILDSCLDLERDLLLQIEDTVYLMECRMGLRQPSVYYPDAPARHVLSTREELTRWVPIEGGDFNRKKKITSAIRRLIPNGQANELGFTLNIRTLRHCLEVRTSPAAEWEIRHVYGQVYRIVKEQFPLLVADAEETMVDGLVCVGGMHHQPYQRHG